MAAAGQEQGVLSQAEQLGVQEVHCRVEREHELRAIVAIHSTRLGPALGGARCAPYPDDHAAMLDAMRLARSMTYKAAIARLPFGGGKTVLMRPPRIRDRRAYFRAFGEFIETLGGRYITAMDSGTEVADMDAIAERTTHVTCTSRQGGDPAPHTALGVFRGIQAAVEKRLGRDELSGLEVAIQGVGHVGARLARHLHEAGARLTVADHSEARARRCAEAYGARVVAPEAIYDAPADVFSPCALGGVLNAETIPRLRASIVAGGANNQLARAEDGAALHRRGICYVPDYAINAGGLIQIALVEEETVRRHVLGLYQVIHEILTRAGERDCPPELVADALAEAMFDNKGGEAGTGVS